LIDGERTAARSGCGVDDITQRKQAEEALRDSEQQLAVIYNNVRDALFHISVERDGRFRFVSVNPAYLTMTGFTQGQVVGKALSEVIREPSFDAGPGKVPSGDSR
jgi:PAS domain-containing protein